MFSEGVSLCSGISPQREEIPWYLLTLNRSFNLSQNIQSFQWLWCRCRLLYRCQTAAKKVIMLAYLKTQLLKLISCQSIYLALVFTKLSNVAGSPLLSELVSQHCRLEGADFTSLFSGKPLADSSLQQEACLFFPPHLPCKVDVNHLERKSTLNTVG